MSPKKGIPHRMLVPGVSLYRKESWPRPGSLPRTCLSFVQVRFSTILGVCAGLLQPRNNTTAVWMYYMYTDSFVSVSSTASPTHHRFRRAPRAFAVLRRRCSHAFDWNIAWATRGQRTLTGSPLTPTNTLVVLFHLLYHIINPNNSSSTLTERCL